MTIRNVRDHGQRFRPRMACLKKVGYLYKNVEAVTTYCILNWIWFISRHLYSSEDIDLFSKRLKHTFLCRLMFYNMPYKPRYDINLYSFIIFLSLIQIYSLNVLANLSESKVYFIKTCKLAQHKDIFAVLPQMLCKVHRLTVRKQNNTGNASHVNGREWLSGALLLCIGLLSHSFSTVIISLDKCGTFIITFNANPHTRRYSCTSSI